MSRTHDLEQPRRYPLTRPGGEGSDPRFTFGLISDVADVLVTHGFPPVVSGDDFVDLHVALFRFLYGGGRS